MNASVLRAVFARNLMSYFASPTGYVFICLFVALSSMAAFWPNAFFNDNSASLSQLNAAFPFIMLIFIPAITMGVWAEERRDGTDELLLTIPATDLDVVLGKYLAALAIYSVALAFSLVTNYLVLNQLASPEGFVLWPAIDMGLILGTYFGYWLVGLAMLAVGMVASFITRNLTVAYILGAVFNAPLVFAAMAGVILPAALSLEVKEWSVGGRMVDFGEGVLSLTGVVYFLAIVAVMLYLSMALIGRRHWAHRGGGLMGVHYLLRVLSLAIIGIGLTIMAERFPARADVTTARLSSLSAETKRLLADLADDRPVIIEAFVSPEVPEEYVQTQKNLLNVLREMDALGGGAVRIAVIDTEPATEEAARAEERYKIAPREVVNRRREKYVMDRIFMGVAVRCGLNRVTIPFFDRGVPVEYELIRSICTVLEEKRKRIGVLTTDAPLYGQFNMQTFSAGRNWPIIDELEKQYDVVRVEADAPIDPKQFDVLLAVQPSSLGEEQMRHFLDAVRSGVPTAIFEDPFPLPSLVGNVPGTGFPRQPPGGMNPMMMRQPPPKGDIAKLWALLGVDFAPDVVISQQYNPYNKVQEFPEEFIFINADAARKIDRRAFNPEDPISSGLQQVLFPHPGAVSKLNASLLELVPLVETHHKTSTVRMDDLVRMSPFGQMGGLNPHPPKTPTGSAYCLAAHITGQVDVPAANEDEPENTNGEAKKDEPKKKVKPTKAKINVVLVTDIDFLAPGIFQLREQGKVPDLDIYLDFDNVTFVLNVLDVLADDNRFLEIRKRRRAHHTLARIDTQTEEARTRTAKLRKEFNDGFDKACAEEQDKLDKKVAAIEKQIGAQRLDTQEALQKLAMAQQSGQKRLAATVDRLKRDRDRNIEQADKTFREKVESVENACKLWAVLLPPIPPLVLAIVVFCVRRMRESEGVARTRLRS
ncbi:MAG: Gldg family protein [Pirellulales bacterium]|nr:Gldg family protein [Pirellulales bacterium]